MESLSSTWLYSKPHLLNHLGKQFTDFKLLKTIYKQGMRHLIIKQNVNVTNFSNIGIKIQMIETRKWEAVKRGEQKGGVPMASSFKVWSQGL